MSNTELIAGARKFLATPNLGRDMARELNKALAYMWELADIAEAAEARIKELEAERDAALAAVERCRGVLASWKSVQASNREQFESGNPGMIVPIDCVGGLSAALDGAPERLSNHCQECGAWGSVETHLRGCSLDGAPEPEEVEWEYAPAWDRRIPTSDRYSIDATDDSIVRRRKAGTWMPVNSGEWE